MSSNNGAATPKDKSKNKGDVDLSHSARGVWLVKVIDSLIQYVRLDQIGL